MRKHYEEVRNYILENLSEEGLFSKRYSEIALDLNINQNLIRGVILQIVKDGLLVVENPPSKGRLSNPLYRIRNNKLEMKEILPQENSLDKTIIFQGVEIKLLMIPNVGYVIKADDISVCTLENLSTLNKIVEANKELFEPNMYVVDNCTYFTRQGVLHYLLKLNLNRCIEAKRQVLADFQNSIVNVMCDSQLKGRLYVTPNNKIKITHNLNCLLEIDKEAVEEMIYDLEKQFNGVMGGIETKLTQQQIEVNKAQKNVKQITSRYESELQSKNRLITENTELKSKLMSKQI